MKTTFSDHCKPNLHFFAEFKPYHTPTANIRTWWRSNKLHRQIWRTKMFYFSFSLIIPLYNHPSLFIVRHMLYTLNLAALCTVYTGTARVQWGVVYLLAHLSVCDVIVNSFPKFTLACAFFFTICGHNQQRLKSRACKLPKFTVLRR